MQASVPLHTPQWSSCSAPPHAPLQSSRQSLLRFLSHVPHLSPLLSPLTTLAQSRHELLPSHTVHLSTALEPPHV